MSEEKSALVAEVIATLRKHEAERMPLTDSSFASMDYNTLCDFLNFLEKPIMPIGVIPERPKCPYEGGRPPLTTKSVDEYYVNMASYIRAHGFELPPRINLLEATGNFLDKYFGRNEQPPKKKKRR